MNEPMGNYMRTGLVHFMAYPETANGYGPTVETIKKLALDDYFEVVEITWIEDAKVRQQVKHIVETAGMRLCYADMPRQKLTGHNINALDESSRKQALQILKDGIDQAYELGAEDYTFMSGRFNVERKEAAYNALIKSTEELCAYAKQKGDMKVTLEIFDHDFDHHALIGPTEWAQRYAREVCARFDNFGLMCDLSHLPQLRETPQQSLPLLKDYIVHAHVGNAVVEDPSNPAYGDKHPRFGFPGSANDIDDLADYLRVLLSIGYLNAANRPILSIEVKPAGGEEPELIIANAKRALNLAWGKV